MFSIGALPKALFDRQNAPLLAGILRGVEREALRVDRHGQLSHRAHPAGLGSALTHPQITTDFSEALLEFITPPTHRVDDLLQQLATIQKYAVSQLDGEMLWTTSMPCKLTSDNDIPVARYGCSNNGKMKTVYRVGLGHRYGRTMQTVSGVHYNFSLPNAFWALLSRDQNRIEDLQAYKNDAYFALIRNFRRHYWLLIYLFGASPAVCESFVSGKAHNLELMNDGHTYSLANATSLRMGDLGYQSTVQESLYVCYNQMESYMRSLCCAITRPHEQYESIGLKDSDGNYKQLNTSILQIENEFYSAIRPKRTAHPGETALAALRNRGVEYIEVRCVDVDPYDPIGISREQINFIDTFLVYCALQESPATDENEAALILQNQKRVVSAGRKPDLTLDLTHPESGKMSRRDWGKHLIDGMRPVAELLDFCSGSSEYQATLEKQAEKINDSRLTPSARIMKSLTTQNISFAQLALEMSQENHKSLQEIPLEAQLRERMMHMSEKSLAEQTAIEQAGEDNFDTFLARYYSQYQDCSR